MPFPPRPCAASALRDAACECRVLHAVARAGGRDRNGEAREREQAWAQSPHHRNVMVMVCVPYTSACGPGIQMSIVAPITLEPVSAATHDP